MAPARRSTRLIGARTKYTVDPFKAAGVSDDSGSEEETNQAEKKGGKAEMNVDDSSSDVEFVDADAGDDDEGDEGEEDYYGENDASEEGEGEEEELEDIEDDGKPGISSQRYTRKRRLDGTVALADDETHSRGIWNPSEHVSKPVHLRVTFGTDERDLLAMIYSRDRWYRGVDSTLPTRASLNEAQSAPDYGFGQSFGVEPEEMNRERTRGWDWYYDADVGGRFRKKQRIEKIGEEDARKTYMPLPKKGKHTVIIGPAANQKVFRLGQNESINFGEAWGEFKSRKKGGSKAEKSDETAAGSAGTKRKLREGWILNMGNKVQCLAWAPNQRGLTQYLAIVAPISDEQRKSYVDATEPKAAPAFSPSPPYPSTLQLWAFKAARDDSLTKTLDTGFLPRLRLALCTDWGDLRRISWCPMARATRDEDDEDAMKNIGLLAGVWGDGKVRVLDIRMSRDPGATEFYKVHSPVFEAKPPSTVCTCVTWLSPSDIAVGCANGYVAVWSIVPSQASTTDRVPYIYQQIHSTYILNLASAYPTHPHFLGTTSMDGETRMTSLLDCQKDKVESNRMRIASPYISYSPFMQAFISSDENDFARLLAVRRFFTSTAAARIPSTVSAMAPCSFWHPSALLGCTEGTVIATNAVRKLVHAKEKQWQQTWFTHEWAAHGQETGSSGVSRFQDGFPVEIISLLRNMMGDRKLVNGTAMITIFEEGTHITALAWNPNQPCAGWASAGMGCGLVRVEDLALE